MTAGVSRKKRWLKVLGFGFLAIAVVALALPVWFPWVFRPVLARLGIRFDAYERVGYTRFALTNVRGGFQNTRFQAERIVGLLPPEWLWRRSSRSSGEEPFLTAAHWSVHIEPAGKVRRSSAAPQSAFAVAGAISDALPAWRSWLAHAELADGRVEFGSNQVMISAVEWHRGKLTATVRSSKPMETFVIGGDFSGAPPYAMVLEGKSSGLASRIRLSRTTDQWQAAGETFWEGNRVVWVAVFGRDGWLPKRGSLKSDHFRVPARLIGFGGYDDPTGAFALDWVDGRFKLEGSARAAPKDGGFSPPFELSLSAHGDPEAVVLEKLRITSPAIQADLSNPIGLSRSGKLATEAATLRVAVDLAKLEGSSFRGKLNGEVMVEAVRGGYPTFEFDLSGEDLTGRGFRIARANLGGRLRWPVLDLDGAEFEFADGSTLGGAGRINLASRQVSDGKWHLDGALARRYLPDGMSYAKLRATGRISGPLGAPRHSGELVAEDFSLPHLRPCRAVATWRAENLAFAEANLKLESGTSALEFAGAVQVGDRAEPSCQIDLKTVALTRDADPLFRLEQTCRMTVRREAPAADSDRPPAWRLKLDGFHWVGQDRELRLSGEVAWPQRGKIDVRGHGLSFGDLSAFVNGQVEGASLSAIDLEAHWDGGPIEFKLSAQGSLPVFADRTFSAHIKLAGDANGCTADPFIISAEGADIARAQGRIPLILTAEPGNVRVRLVKAKPFDFQAVTEPNQGFWDFASQHLGVRIGDPKVEARLHGTLDEVQGTLRAQASRIGRSASTNAFKAPPLEKLRIEARFEPDRVVLREFAFEVESQPVRITGELPMRGKVLLDLISNGALPDWRQARVRLEIADARVEPFARYLPGVLNPQGRLSVSLGIVPGGEVEGEVRIAGAVTRPISPLTAIRDIDATVRFSGRGATITRFTGRMGGREVSVSGRFGVAESGEPQFDLRLRGDNVPLVYRPGLLLRSDFDIRFAQAGSQPATISGDVNLRDGLYLQDLRALVPAGRAEPLGRPPYFSVTENPFADWKLDLNVHGERFLRVRTPFFRGEITAAFQLKGNLQEPQALGEARIHSGLIKFPFGTLEVDQGQASLTSDHPYEPELFVTASSRLYGYHIKMEIGGTASAPSIAFSSTPPLTSEQVLLMLAAGELPRDELSTSRESKAGRFALYLGKDMIARLVGSEDTADRLTVRSGEDVSQEGKSTYYIEYKLSDDLSVVGEYDRFNALNAGLKLRIFSR